MQTPWKTAQPLSTLTNATVHQLSEQSDLKITLDFNIFNAPLTHNEEIHLLQIIREASQNAMHHRNKNTIAITDITSM